MGQNAPGNWGRLKSPLLNLKCLKGVPGGLNEMMSQISSHVITLIAVDVMRLKWRSQTGNGLRRGQKRMRRRGIE
eukprot:4617958-Karenia_brevis.AAC.1